MQARLAAGSEDKDLGAYGNEVLYRMCRERPYHTDAGDIFSKLWLIGRSYAATLERGAGRKFSLEKAARKLATKGIDRLIATVEDITYLETENLPDILHVHAELNKMFRQLPQRNPLNTHSLTSKYLHFHKPDAFLI